MADEKYIELHLISRAPTATQQELAEKRALDRENGRKLALAHAEEALQAAVVTMRTALNARDHATVLKAAKMIMDRAWGTPKTEDNTQQSLSNRNILEIFASMSLQADEIVVEKPVEAVKIEHNPALEALFEEVDDVGESGGVPGEVGEGGD